jgi:hypothetical protein
MANNVIQNTLRDREVSHRKSRRQAEVIREEYEYSGVRVTLDGNVFTRM